MIDNIQLITILPTTTKIVESIICELLMKTLHGENGKIHKAQQGFRPGAGTEINLARLLYLFENI